MTGTPINAQVNYEAPGKQTEYLRVPHSVRRLADNWIAVPFTVPFTVTGNGEGPTLIIVPGNHEENEGQTAVSTLARQLAPGEIRRRLILTPTASFPARSQGSGPSAMQS